MKITGNYLLIKIIRKAALLRAILPAALLFLAACTLFYLPGENYFSPRPLNSKSNYENFYNKNLPYVSVSVPRLSFTGLANCQGDHIDGYYYYTLTDGFCQFYLLDAKSGFPEPSVRENMEITGRLIRLEEEEYGALLENMAASLGWTVSSLEKMTSPYAVSVLPYPIISVFLIRILAVAALLFSTADLLCCFFWYLMPGRSPAFSLLRERDAAFRLALRLEPDLSSGHFYRNGKWYLVSGVLICASAERPWVIPLPLLRGGKIKQPGISFHGRTFCLPKALILTLKSGASVKFRSTKNADPESLLLLIKEQNPDFRIG